MTAQDIHFTNFQLAPMSLNPALTGDFHGTLRGGAIYRDQNTQGYNTIGAGLEFNIPFALRKQDWITIGAEFVQDKERIIKGINVNQITQTNLALAYHFAIDKKYRNVITAAVQYKIMSSKFNPSGLTAYKELQNSSLVNPTISGLVTPSDGSKGKSIKDWVGAIGLHSKFRKKDFLKTGISFAHILHIDKSVLSQNTTGSADVLPTRITGYVASEFFLSKSISIQPTAYFQYQSPFSEIALQTLVGIELKPEKNIKINPGLGYRIGDAVEFLFVMDFGKFKGGVSFDLTTSKYKSGKGIQNGLEFGLSYTTTIIKKPKVKPVIFCPRL